MTIVDLLYSSLVYCTEGETTGYYDYRLFRGLLDLIDRFSAALHGHTYMTVILSKLCSKRECSPKQS